MAKCNENKFGLTKDQIRRVAVDIGKEVSVYVKSMYPAIVRVAPDNFLAAVRQKICNQITSAFADGDKCFTTRGRKLQARKATKIAVAKTTMSCHHKPQKRGMVYGGTRKKGPDTE
jgi:hypothetical protein